MISARDLLKENNLKLTPARIAILELMQASHSPLNAEEVFKEVSKDTHTSLATIYRTLAQLSELGLLMQDNSSDGSVYYQFAKESHSHYLTCSVCNTRIHLKSCPLGPLEKTIEKETGYKITGHSLEFLGICPNCQGKQK